MADNSPNTRPESVQEAYIKRTVDDIMPEVRLVAQRVSELDTWRKAEDRLLAARNASEAASEHVDKMLESDEADGIRAWNIIDNAVADLAYRELNNLLETRAPTWTAVVRKLELLVEREAAEEGDALHTILKDARRLLATTPRWLEPETLA